MAVCNSAKYLGVLLGPHAGQSQWSKALRKFQDRINTINSLHLPAELTKGQYTSRALPTIGYIAQVVPPPKCPAYWHESCHESLHMCGNSLSFAAAFSLDCLGGPKFTEPVSYLKSCNIKASLQTITGFEWMHHELLRHAVSELPLGRHRYKLAIPKGWDAPAFCTNLYLASTHPCVSLLQPPIWKNSLQAIIYKALVCSEEQSQQAWLKLTQSRALLFRDWPKTYLSSLGSSCSSSSSSAFIKTLPFYIFLDIIPQFL